MKHRKVFFSSIMLSIKEKIYLVKTYYLVNCDYSNLKVQFEQEFKKTSPDNAVIKRLVKKFDETGSICRVAALKRTITSVSLVEDYFTLNPSASVRMAEKGLQISRSQIHHILKDILKFKVFKTQTRQLLTASAKIKRLRFANCFDTEILDKIWFSDESYFYLNPKANKNQVVWAKSRPVDNFVQKPSHSAKILVWMAVSHNGIFWRPINGNMDTQSYLNLLKIEFIPYLKVRNLIDTTIFMQDGAPCHTSKTVLSYLHKHFKERVISTRYPDKYNMGLEWPPYSPDMTPLDYCIWGTLKSRVAKHKPITLIDLNAALTQEISLLDKSFIVRTIANIIPRIASLKKNSGGHIE